MIKRILIGVLAVSAAVLLFSCGQPFAGGPGGPGGQGRPGMPGPDMPQFADNDAGEIIRSIKAELSPEQFNALVETINKRLSSGESIEQIIGKPDREFGPRDFRNGPVGVLGIFIPIVAMICMAGVLVVLFGTRYKRDQMLIEKGIYQTVSRRKFPMEAALLVTGIILIFWGLALSVFNCLSFGLNGRSLSGGSIPFIIGIGVFVSFFVYRSIFSSKEKIS
jgi:hypothetical protein